MYRVEVLTEINGWTEVLVTNDWLEALSVAHYWVNRCPSKRARINNKNNTIQEVVK